jgi:hypothetical protein
LEKVQNVRVDPRNIELLARTGANAESLRRTHERKSKASPVPTGAIKAYKEQKHRPPRILLFSLFI